MAESKCAQRQYTKIGLYSQCAKVHSTVPNQTGKENTLTNQAVNSVSYHPESHPLRAENSQHSQQIKPAYYAIFAIFC